MLKQYDYVRADYKPQRRGTLRKESLAFIGVTLIWQVGWMIEEGETYEGQWAMIPMPGIYMGWAPAEDLANSIVLSGDDGRDAYMANIKKYYGV